MSPDRAPGNRELEEISDTVLDMVGGRADAAVTVAHLSEGLTRFARSFIHQNVGDEQVSVALDVVVSGRPASVSTTRTDEASLRRLVETALGAATVQDRKSVV